MRTKVIYVDLGYWAILDSIHPKGDPASWGNKRIRVQNIFFFLIFTRVTGPARSLSLELSDARVFEPQIRARIGTTAHFCEAVVLKLFLPSPTGARERGHRETAGVRAPGQENRI